ncbi:hypothetical protein C1M51_03755 [Methylibium sp. Pch-M]|uniref:TonB-dependent receptor n=1 Tax=Methylibium sp. Pch-M TaxID=2082386 RepID=UPI001012A156|nr:TonB-dependent receptor [Methylibium sp. Pch-M]QAZ38610.1 hypothetical protein C1M51_03755 [Methylibium sp. Pch-M]
MRTKTITATSVPLPLGAVASAVLAMHAQVAWAQNAAAPEEPSPQLQTVTVSAKRLEGRTELSNRPEALPAQTYVLDKERIQALPFSDATDLLRSTPGVTFGASSPGGDIGDDISIRGFSSYHGADVAVFIDDVPVNWPDSGMRHGMVDFNWLNPDLIERIEILKGPFSAEYGNFNLAGTILIHTKTSESSSLAVEGGSYGHYRAVGTYGGQPDGVVTPFLSYEVLDRRGYRDHSNYRRLNAFNKFTVALPDGRLSLRLNASVRDNESAGFLLADDVRQGTVSRRSASPDSLTDKGGNDYYTLVANYVPSDARGVRATVYAGRDELLLIDTAFGPPQGYTRAQRNYAGWRVSKAYSWQDRALLTLGTDGQFDRGNVLGGDSNGQGAVDPAALSRDQSSRSRAAGLYAQGQVRLAEPVKLVGGLRYDRFSTRVTNRLFPNSGSASLGVASPKIGVVFSPAPWLEIFANTGTGFRSPAATELSPNRAGAAFNRDLDPAKLRSSDLGTTLRLPAGLTLSAGLFTTKTERELRRDPANPVNIINIGGTKRDGYEMSVDWIVTDHLSFNASHTSVDTRIESPATPGADRVITVPDDTQTLGVSWTGGVGAGWQLNADLYAKRIGKRPLRADGSLYAEPQTTFAIKTRLTRGAWSGFVQLDYAPDRYSSDFVYDLGNGVVYDPRPVVSALAGIKYTFN